MVEIPEGYESLLERPLYGHLATMRPDGNPQVNPMWFAWDGELLRFTHTTKRQKYRNFEANPNIAMSIVDPDNPYRYLEVRGIVEEIDPGSDRRVLSGTQRPLQRPADRAAARQGRPRDHRGAPDRFYEAVADACRLQCQPVGR